MYRTTIKYYEIPDGAIAILNQAKIAHQEFIDECDTEPTIDRVEQGLLYNSDTTTFFVPWIALRSFHSEWVDE